MIDHELVKIAEKEKVNFISLNFTNIFGELKSVFLPVRELRDILHEGCGFDGSSAGYVSVNQSDLVLRPDANTFAILPWEEESTRTARLICDVAARDLSDLSIDPRTVLKKVVRKMKDEFGESWEFILAPELEFYLLDRDEEGRYKPSDQADYFSSSPKDSGEEFRKTLSLALDSMGIVCQKNHHEVPNGKHEINFKFGHVLEIADKTVTFKHVVKYYTAKKHMIATFMPKPFFGTYGTGMHVHLNLFDSASDQNLFYDGSREYNLSETGEMFLAGILRHAKALAGITNPSVNSYKRLVPGWEAPVYISWGFFNRSALLRIPATSPKGIRAELRSPDASSNPYLAFAAILAAGMDGLRRKMSLPLPINENIYEMSIEEREIKGIDSLPGNLKEALEYLEKDEIFKEFLGKEIIEKFLSQKWKEWEEFSVKVHDWELERYLNV